MSLEVIRNALRFRPFRPFRLCITDGATYDVRHPELCVVGARSVFIGMPPAGQPDAGYYDHFAIVDLIHITRLEPIPAPAPDAQQN